MLNIRRTLRHLVLVCLAGMATAPLRANIAYFFEAAPVTNDSRLTIGFQFRTLETVSVSALGYYDDGGDGLLTPHNVGIFDSNGVLQAATFLTSGTTTPLVGQFRYQDITPVLLPAG